MKLEKSIELVSRASSGIGQATAERLVSADFKIYGTSRRGVKVASNPSMLLLDVTSDASVEATVREVMRLDGRIDGLVNQLVGRGGFEPPTNGLKVRCSTS